MLIVKSGASILFLLEKNWLLRIQICRLPGAVTEVFDLLTLTDKAQKRIIKSRGVFHHCCLNFAGATEERLFPISALKPLLVKLFADETPLLSVNQAGMTKSALRSMPILHLIRLIYLSPSHRKHRPSRSRKQT